MKRVSIVLLITAMLLTLLKLWLAAQQSLIVLQNSDFDDTLFVRLAQNILNGVWLGPYDKFTLLKGPFYPLWIAFAHALNIPLLLSERLLYIVACAAFTLAVRPKLKYAAASFALYLVLLYQPMTYTAHVERVLREGIYPALTLLILAGAIGLGLRAGQATRRQIPWAILLGLSLGAFWITREEGIWIFPALALLAGWIVFDLWRRKFAGWQRVAGAWGMAAVLAILPTLAVSSLNYSYYGLFAKTELDSREFLSAYGSLARVKPEVLMPNVPLTRQNRQRIYKVSPTFAKLEDCLDNRGVASVWAKRGPKDENTQREILGGWFVFALRDAVDCAGYYDQGRFPGAFYQQVADEVNAACDQKHKLDCYSKRATIAPVWHNAYILPVTERAYKAATLLVTFTGFNDYPLESQLSSRTTLLFMQVTQEDVYRPSADVSRLQILDMVAVIYQWATPVLVILALAGYLYEFWLLLQKRADPERLAISTILLAAIGVRLILLAILDYTSFPILDPVYLSALYPLLVAFIVLNAAWGIERVLPSARSALPEMGSVV